MQAACTPPEVGGSWSILQLHSLFSFNPFSLPGAGFYYWVEAQTTGGPVISKCHVQMLFLKIHF